MKVVYLSPHFPPHQYLYPHNLRELGEEVLGIGDHPWDGLSSDQKHALTEYRQVGDLEDHTAVYGTVAEWIQSHGPIDRVESHNEHWLPLEARLRAEFGIPGDREDDLECTRRKSCMKEVFRGAGIAVAAGLVVREEEDARRFARLHGYPLVAKPDIGVGASATYRIGDEEELSSFLRESPPVDYFLETFLHGRIVTFDGLADREGRVLYCFSMEYSGGVMEAVNGDLDLYYYTHREIPADLEEAGRAAVAAFGVREKFFHLEFFRTVDGRVVALEANLRPPGGYSVDMFNWSSEIDLYRAWAEVVTGRAAGVRYDRPYHCCFVNRKERFRYLRRHQEILDRFGGSIVFHTAMPPAFRGAMGDYAYFLRVAALDSMHAAAAWIQEKT